VEQTSSILCNNHRISSSEIRKLLANANIQSASKMLGHEFSITGKIIHGLKNGRSIGFPTINIPIKRKISPVYGIFAGTIDLDGATYQGVCSIGNRPIIGDKKTLLEVFLFDFNQKVKNAVDFVRESGDRVAATITPQHLLNNRNDMLVGGIKPHTYCLPVLKRADCVISLSNYLRCGIVS
jgi:FAD synthase